MKKIICIMGEPGAGKSSLVKRLMAELSDVWDNRWDAWKLVPYHKHQGLYVLGKYGEPGIVLEGTDRCSMALQPETVKFIDQLPDGAKIIFEGSRLATTTFLNYCAENHELHIFYLQVSEEERQRRYVVRNFTPEARFIKSMVTRYKNILSNLTFLPLVEKEIHETPSDTDRIVKKIRAII